MQRCGAFLHYSLYFSFGDEGINHRENISDGVSSAWKKMKNFFSGNSDMGNSQASGKVFTSKNSTAQSENKTADRIEGQSENIDGLMSTAKVAGPKNAAPIFKSIKLDTDNNISEKVKTVSKVINNVRKTVGHVTKAKTIVKNANNLVNTSVSQTVEADSLVRTERRGNMTVTTHVPRKKKN